jgi:hypothetical protein
MRMSTEPKFVSLADLRFFADAHDFTGLEITLPDSGVIQDVGLFLDTHVQYCTHYKGVQLSKPYWVRLQYVYALITIGHC